MTVSKEYILGEINTIVNICGDINTDYNERLISSMSHLHRLYAMIKSSDSIIG